MRAQSSPLHHRVARQHVYHAVAAGVVRGPRRARAPTAGEAETCQLESISRRDSISRISRREILQHPTSQPSSCLGLREGTRAEEPSAEPSARWVSCPYWPRRPSWAGPAKYRRVSRLYRCVVTADVSFRAEPHGVPDHRSPCSCENRQCTRVGLARARSLEITAIGWAG